MKLLTLSMCWSGLVVALLLTSTHAIQLTREENAAMLAAALVRVFEWNGCPIVPGH